MADNMQPMLSVCMITYKHEHLVKQAIESILAQKVNFPFEFVIAEDCSPDGTLEICKQYANKYPEIIRLLPSEKNMGAVPNFCRALAACKGKYIAFCEGDDYWIDEFKLQKQVDFLEHRKDLMICFSEVKVINELDVDIPDYAVHYKEVYTIEDVILSELNIIPSPSLVFRNELPDPMPSFVYEAMSGDLSIQLLLLSKGNAGIIREKLAAYRHHAGGITKSKENIENGQRALVKLFAAMDEYLEYRYNSSFRKRFQNIARYNLIAGSEGLKGISKLQNYFTHFRRYIKYADKLDVREIIYYHAILFTPWLLRVRKHNNG